ncbi:threonine aldolase family protein [Robertmurraya massiliosenegalensis]|uniref:threonine aldolase family protein n=1 Tax=Robertmurraya massiliosenegalensis TaxID=1287657 RepID=UPI00031F870A|nr:GntG family PLP-dependent aldolase [Robertmurraya massiliosenegalensis]
MIDFRSDTVTKPIREMLDAMYHAEVGDDGYQEDPTVNRLEKMVAELLGKEDSLFVSSGTQGNLISILVNSKHGDEIIVESKSHLNCSEREGVESLARVNVVALAGCRGAIPLQILKQIPHEKTSIISIENTHARSAGSVVSTSYLKELYTFAQNKGITVHMDGARLFNAAVALQQDIKQFTQYTDTVSICLSKGLATPAGSILAGTEAFIEEARKWRRNLGGRMRQIGYLAATGIYALENMVNRLNRDHDLAKFLGREIEKINGLQLEYPVETNIVLVNCKALQLDDHTCIQFLKDNGILVKLEEESVIRFVVHKDIKTEDIEYTLERLQIIIS